MLKLRDSRRFDESRVSNWTRVAPMSHSGTEEGAHPPANRWFRIPLLAQALCRALNEDSGEILFVAHGENRPQRDHNDCQRKALGGH